jgi:hypothetical protein
MVVTNGRLSPVLQQAVEMDWDFPEPFVRQSVVELPFSEIVMIARHTHSSEIHTYLNRTALRDARDPAAPPPEPANKTGRSAQIFLVGAIVRNGEHIRRIAAQRQDIYASRHRSSVKQFSAFLMAGRGTVGLKPRVPFSMPATIWTPWCLIICQLWSRTAVPNGNPACLFEAIPPPDRRVKSGGFCYRTLDRGLSGSVPVPSPRRTHRKHAYGSKCMFLHVYESERGTPSQQDHRRAVVLPSKTKLVSSRRQHRVGWK